MQQSIIIQLFETIKQDRDELILSSNNVLKIKKKSVLRLSDTVLDYESDDLFTLIKDLKAEINSIPLDFAISTLEKLKPRDIKLDMDSTQVKTVNVKELEDNLNHLRTLITQKDEQIGLLVSEIEKLKKSTELGDDAKLQTKLNKNLELLNKWGIGELGENPSQRGIVFQNSIKNVLVDYMNFIEIPRNEPKNEILRHSDDLLTTRVEAQKSLESGTVDVHLLTRNAKKTRTIHIEAKSSINKPQINVSRFITHNQNVDADYGVVVGPIFAPKDMFEFIKNCREYKKGEFNYAMITIDAFNYLLDFIVSRKLTQEFFLQIIQLNSIIATENEITEIINSISRAQDKDLKNYFSKELFIKRPEIDEEEIKGIKRICDEKYEAIQIKFSFKDFIEDIYKEWEEEKSSNDEPSLSYKEVNRKILSVLKKNQFEYLQPDADVQSYSIKTIIFLSFLDFFNFELTKDLRKQLLNLETKINVDQRQDRYFKDFFRLLENFV